MAKKGGKSKDKASEKSGFTFAGIDIPAALKGSGVTIDNLTKHPLVAGLAAMALESLASQIRAKTAATDAARAPKPPEPAPAPPPAPSAPPPPPPPPPPKSAAAKKSTARKAGAKPAAKKTAAKPAAKPKPKPAA